MDVIEKKFRPAPVTDVPWEDVKVRMTGFRCIATESPVYFYNIRENHPDCTAVLMSQITEFRINTSRDIGYIIKMIACSDHEPSRQ
jgi:hypothetical protein